MGKFLRTLTFPFSKKTKSFKMMLMVRLGLKSNRPDSVFLGKTYLEQVGTHSVDRSSAMVFK